MNLLKRALLLVLIAGAAVMGYLYLFKDLQSAQAFDVVQDLTPGDLEVRCGMPLRMSRVSSSHT